MVACEQCEVKTQMTNTSKTPMDKGTQPGVNSVNSFDSPTCACACVRDVNQFTSSHFLMGVRMHASKSRTLACRSIKTIHTLHSKKKTNADKDLFGMGHSVKNFTVFTAQKSEAPC